MESLSAIIRQPQTVDRFRALLADRAPQFLASLIQVGDSLPGVDPRSILAAAAMAASLDLPVVRSLGYAWIIPYQSGSRQIAQFQIGARGYVQLALRSGAYHKIGTKSVNAAAVIAKDEVGDVVMDWSRFDEDLPPTHFFAAFFMANGFRKADAWSEAKVRRHAQHYSQAFRKGTGPWKTHFPQMGQKTVLSYILRHYGLLNVVLQNALFYDQRAAVDLDAPIEAVDRVPDAPEDGGAGEVEAQPSPPEPAVAAPAAEAAVTQPATDRQQAVWERTVTAAGLSFDHFAKYARKYGWIDEQVTGFDQLPDQLADDCVAAGQPFLDQLKESSKTQ